MKTATKKSSLDRVIRSINIQTQRRTLYTLLDWIDHHKIMLRPDQPFDLAGHEYLRAIYEDTSPEKDIQKAAQIGMSTEEVLRALWLADQLVCKELYYFPNDDALDEFSQDRFDPMVQNSPYLREQVQERGEAGGVYNKNLKQIGRSSIYMRGMWTRVKVKSVDGDCLALDELDEAKPAMVSYAKDRVLHSKLAYITQLSQPTFPDFGINLAFSSTDQLHYMLKCPGCGSWNCLEEDWPKNFIELSADQARIQGRSFYRGCLKCGAELDMAAGQWVAKYPSRKRRGYWVSGLYTQIRSEAWPEPADRIMDRYRRARTSADKTSFTHSVIGDAYGGDSQPITDKVLNDCEARYVMGREAGYATGMGVDVGDILHIEIRGRGRESRRPRVLWVERTDSWPRLYELMRFWCPQVAVIDAMPYKSSAKEFARAFPGRVFLQYFKNVEKQTVEGEDEKEVPVIQVNRTESLDDTTREFKEGLIEIPELQLHEGRLLGYLEEFRTHLKHLVTETVTKDDGSKARNYKGNVPNHFGMAANSARIAEELAPYNVSSGVLPVFGEIH